MIPNYRTFTLTATAEDDIVKLIYEELKKEGYKNPDFELRFIGFEAAAGTQIIINGNPNKVPSTKYFITPYTGDEYMLIKTVKMPAGCAALDFHVIY